MFNFFKKRMTSTTTEEGWTIHDEKLQELHSEVEDAFVV